MVLITIVHGVYKPTNITGGPHIAHNWDIGPHPCPPPRWTFVSSVPAVACWTTCCLRPPTNPWSCLASIGTPGGTPKNRDPGTQGGKNAGKMMGWWWKWWDHWWNLPPKWKLWQGNSIKRSWRCWFKHQPFGSCLRSNGFFCASENCGHTLIFLVPNF